MLSRRSFIKRTAAASLVAVASPVSFSAFGSPTDSNFKRSGRLNLSYRPHELKLYHPFNVATFSRTTTPDVLVEIEYDGLIGYGEASMPPYLGESVESVVKFLNSLDLSQFSSPFQIEEIHEYMDSISPEGDRAAKASVDIALHDLCGKIMQQPWYKIWGLDPAKAPCTSFTIGIDTPEVVRQKTLEAAPYKVLKVKVGVDGDKETILTIRDVVGKELPICVDANQGWKDRDVALEMCHWLAEQGCIFVEQPLPKERVDDIAWIRERSPLPIVADESCRRLADIKNVYGAYDAINIKLMKSTGMHEAYQMASAAKALGMDVMIGCMTETSCAVTAAAQLAPLARWADLDGNLLITNDPFDGVTLMEGKLTLPTDRPGIGVVKKA